MTAEDVRSAQRIEWLQQLPAFERERLQRGSSRREVGAGELVFSPTPRPESVYLLERGLVRIYRLSEAGSETTFGYVAPGEVFGELAGFGDYARDSFAQAVRASTVRKIPREVFQRLIASHPDLVLDVTRQIGDRLKRIESRVENLVFHDVRSRVAAILAELAHDFGREDPEGVLIEVPLTQGDLATLVGSTRQSVNASLRELEAEGLVRRKQRRYLVKAIEPLQRAARIPR